MPKRLLLPLIFIVFTAKTARANDCPVRIDSAAAPTRWATAVDTVTGQLGAEHGDCASIEVHPDATGAEVTLTTSDGREARRRIADPEELGPLVRALLIVVPPSEPPSTVTAPAEEVVPAPSPQEDAPRAKPPLHLPVVVGANGGISVTSAENATPYGEVFASLALRRWEIGAFGRWEAEHDLDPEHRTQHASLAALGGGALVGRRDPVGTVVALVYGATVAAYAADEESHIHIGITREHSDRAIFDPRIGTFFGAVFPRNANVRLRGQLGAEASLAAAIPGWGFGAALGIETGGP